MSHFCEMCDQPIEPGQEIEWSPRSFVCRGCALPEILEPEAIEALRDPLYLFNGDLSLAAMVAVSERLK